MNEPQLGAEILHDDDGPVRDAIHIAIATVVADVQLSPGAHVGFIGESRERVSSEATRYVGIVDPFLTVPVPENARFWLLLYPYSITSLRHEWTHPAFEDDDSKSRSEEWLRRFISTAECPDYEMVMAAVIAHQAGAAWSDDYLHFNGYGAHGDIPGEFWHHVQIVTGMSMPIRATSFSCSC